MYNNKKSVILISVLFIFCAVSAFSQVRVAAEISNNRYTPGDLVSLKIKLKDNSGLHGFYFDMDYPGNLLKVESVKQYDFTGGVPQTGKLRYAYGPKTAQIPGPMSHHFTASWALDGSGLTTKKTGTVFEINFRVTDSGYGNATYGFEFYECAAVDGEGNEIADTQWLDSRTFSLENPSSGTSIRFYQPLMYDVLDKEISEADGMPAEAVSLNTVRVELEDTVFYRSYYIQLYNKEIEHDPVGFTMHNQLISDEYLLPMKYGFNTFIAEVRDSSSNLLDTHAIPVYLSRDDEYITIDSPDDHALLNTDMINVRVISGFDNVEVNGETAVLSTEKDNGRNVFYVNIWLHKGFNDITAVSYGQEGIQYKDQIEVFYHKNSSLFNFIFPEAGETFKPGEGNLRVLGEIGSEFSEDGSDSGGMHRNEVSLDVIYKPYDPAKSSCLLIDDKKASITENNYSYDNAQSKYIFRNDFPIPMEDLDNGTLEINAYLNRSGEAYYEDKISRIVYIDNNRLWINLIQPNVYSEDILDTAMKFETFSGEEEDYFPEGFKLTNSGAIELEGSASKFSDENLDGIVCMAEDYDGNLYAVSNSSTGVMTLFKKGINGDEWSVVLTRDGLFIYDIKSTSYGLVLAGSNLFSTEDSGIFLVQDGNLLNIDFPEYLPHAQFVEVDGSTVSFYGKYYSNLYSFNLYSLKSEKNESGEIASYRIDNLEKISFANNKQLNGFGLSRDRKFAYYQIDVPGRDNDLIEFFQKQEEGYVPLDFKHALDSADNKIEQIFGTKVIMADDYDSNYQTLLIIDESGLESDSQADYPANLLMRDKNTGRIYHIFLDKPFKSWLGLDETDDLEDLLIGKDGEEYCFVYNNSGEWKKVCGNIFFNNFYNTGAIRELAEDGSISIDSRDIFISSGGDFINMGQIGGDVVTDSPLYSFRDIYDQDAEGSIYYVNEGADGINGFSFVVESKWISDEADEDAEESESPVSIGFSACSNDTNLYGDAPLVSSLLDGETFHNLNDFLKMGGDTFTVTNRYYPDKKRNLRIIEVFFNELAADAFLKIDLGMTPSSGRTPGIGELTIYKKIPVQVAKGEEEIQYLQVQGFIYDKTVESVSIASMPAEVRRDGSFSGSLQLNTSQDKIPVNLHCINAAGEYASLDFSVLLIESNNGIGDLSYQLETETDEDNVLTPLQPLEPWPGTPVLYINKDKMYLSGSYYGLSGAVCGYEVYKQIDGQDVLVHRDIFQTKPEKLSTVLDLLDAPEGIGPGYSAGVFAEQPIQLFAGEQKLVVFVENPGGTRFEYQIDNIDDGTKEYPRINYNLGFDDQKIEFENLEDFGEGEAPLLNDVKIAGYNQIYSYEEAYPDNPGEYRFVAEFEIVGYLQTLYNTNLIVQSEDADLVFENGENQMLIIPDSAKRFSIKVKTVQKDSVVKNFDFMVTPDAPPLAFLNTAVRITSRKWFRDADFTPDFSLMLPGEWEDEELEASSPLIEMVFNRDDVPLPDYMYATFIVNYTTTIEGWVDKHPDIPGAYVLKDSEGKLINLTNVKQGMNWVWWKFEYKNDSYIEKPQMTICTSNDTDQEMFRFEYVAPDTQMPTEIEFSSGLKASYYGTVYSEETTSIETVLLPTLNISKDVYTTLDFILNGKAIDISWETDTGGPVDVDNAAINLNTCQLNQGLNSIEIIYNEQYREPEHKTYIFLFDNQLPQILEDSVVFDETYQKLNELAVIAEEASFDNAYLLVDSAPLGMVPTIDMLDENLYRVVWSGLDIDPTSDIDVDVRDMTGKNTVKDIAVGFIEIDRPNEPDVHEQRFNIPVYKGTPDVANEILYENGEMFARHHKFYPVYYPEMYSIKSEITNNDNYLIRYKTTGTDFNLIEDDRSKYLVFAVDKADLAFEPGRVAEGIKLTSYLKVKHKTENTVLGPLKLDVDPYLHLESVARVIEGDNSYLYLIRISGEENDLLSLFNAKLDLIKQNVESESEYDIYEKILKVEYLNNIDEALEKVYLTGHLPVDGNAESFTDNIVPFDWNYISAPYLELEELRKALFIQRHKLPVAQAALDAAISDRNSKQAEYNACQSVKNTIDANIATYTAQEAEAKQAYEDAIPIYDAAKQKYDDAKDIYDPLKEAYDNAETAYNNAVNNYNHWSGMLSDLEANWPKLLLPKPPLPLGQYRIPLPHFNENIRNWYIYYDNKVAANTDKNNKKKTMDDAKTAMDPKKAAMDNAKTAMDNAKSAMDDAEAAWNSMLNKLNKEKAKLGPAIADLNAAWTALQTAEAVLTNAQNAKTAIEAEISRLESAINGEKGILAQMLDAAFGDGTAGFSRNVAKQDDESSTVYFWLRSEDEILQQYNIDNSLYPASDRKRVFTIYSSTGIEMFSFGYSATGDYYFYDGLSDKYYYLDECLRHGLDSWDFLTILFDKENNSLRILENTSEIFNSLTDTELGFTSGENFIETLTNDDNRLVFGPDKQKDDPYKFGFYSLANCFYIEKMMQDEEIDYMYEMGGTFSGNEMHLDFDNPVQEFNAELLTLNSPNPSINNNDYIIEAENAVFNEPDSSSFKASSPKHDYLQRLQIAGQTSAYVVLDGADSYSLVNAGVTQNSDSAFTIKPEAGNGPSRYFFGNKNHNYNLKPDRWYSISGEITDIAEGASVRMVMRLNGMEQDLELGKGTFNFIYDNYNNLVPYEIRVFIETDGELTIDSDSLKFNEGNFILEREMEQTSAVSRFAFGHAGTVDFYFKPFNSNRNGAVNYPAVLLDCDYFRIGTMIPENMDEAVYYAVFKKPGDNEKNEIELFTNTLVSNDWQHIQLTYDSKTAADETVGIAYLYIDGKITAFYEGGEFSNVFTGVSDETFTVTLGSDCALDHFADGFLDNINLENYYYDCRFENMTPYEMEYRERTETVEIPESGGLTMEKTVPEICFTTHPGLDKNEAALSYRIEDMDGTTLAEGSGFEVIDLSEIPGGKHRLVTYMKYNEYNYPDVYTFNIDTRPVFSLVEKPPIVFSNYNSNLEFKFLFDQSDSFERETRVFAGIAVRIDTGDETVDRYLVQDFIDQNTGQWLIGQINETSGNMDWTSTEMDNSGRLGILFGNVLTEQNINCEFRSFYFEEEFEKNQHGFDVINPEKWDYILPLAELNVKAEKITSQDTHYKLSVSVCNIDSDDNAGSRIFEDIDIRYTFTNIETGDVFSDILIVDNTGKLDIYLDEVLPDFGCYGCTIELLYKDNVYNTVNLDEEIVFGQIDDDDDDDDDDFRYDLRIIEFNLVHLDRDTGQALFYLEYYVNTPKGVKSVDLVIEVNGEVVDLTANDYLYPEKSQENIILEPITVPLGESDIHVMLKLDGYTASEDLSIDNSVEKPKVFITNGVESTITYNNVYFSWRGTYKGEYNTGVEYSYNLDGKGWTSWNSEWRDVHFYNLEEELHTFKLKARYGNVESIICSQTFFVDINKPEFIADKITVENIYADNGVLKAVRIDGAQGAVKDVSLRSLYINGSLVKIDDDGSFTSDPVKLVTDGQNDITLTAYDIVENFTDFTVNIDNTLTRIIYPDQVNVKYSPLTIVGRLLDTTVPVQAIYLSDPTVHDNGDYTLWKKAVINEDRTFFIEDVFINPGSVRQQLTTKLKMVCTYANGLEFEKEIPVKANEIVMPIELKFSTHAVEGENADTKVIIDCKANVDNISSWSIDFNGDGIYDAINLVANPELESAKTKRWVHTYSSLGQVHPRVRVITAEGLFFSVSDMLIIHEKIKDASPMKVINPISLSVVKTEYNEETMFILRKNDQDFVIDVYTIPQFDPQPFQQVGQTIDISSYGIENPVKVRAVKENLLFVAENDEGTACLHILERNDFGNYGLEQTITFDDEISDFALNDNSIAVSFDNKQLIAKGTIEGNRMVVASLEELPVELQYSRPMDSDTALVFDYNGLLVSDKHNQRLLRLSDDLKAIEKFGTRGGGEGEFLLSSWIHYHGNRIFVYDQERRDVQVFDDQFGLICTLEFSNDPEYHNYVEAGFFNDLADIEVISKQEGNLVYYYAMLLSRSSGKLAVLRLPQWEEMRAKVRSNKLVYVNEGEVFTAKPDGADLQRILSSDSIPLIKGHLDYPALSPDGQTLVFTSRMDLYSGGTVDDGEAFGYDNMYLFNIESQTIKKLGLGILEGSALERPVFNSNGSKIIFSAKTAESKWQIYLYEIATGNVSQLFVSDENARFPYFSPDDRYIVFTSDYNGSENIEIIDTRNTNIRFIITSNTARNSMPVWIRVYPEELSTGYEAVSSKIAFVSEKNFEKSVYVVYMEETEAGNIAVFNRRSGSAGGDPDDAAICLTTYYDDNGDRQVMQSDYPCFTGDGRSLVFEINDSVVQDLRRFDFDDPVNRIEISDYDSPEFVYDTVESIPEELAGQPDYKGMLFGARRPSGMKNMISNFNAEVINGNQISMTWNRYTKNDIYYMVDCWKSGAAKPVRIKVSSQEGIVIPGMIIGQEYRVRVCIVESEEEVATSKWITLEVPKVAAIPSYEIDETNPYLVNLHAWKPETVGSDEKWTYSWLIDNVEYQAYASRNYPFEFATSGTKTISLIVKSGENGTDTAISDPFKVSIVSDIIPFIDYDLANDGSSIELSAMMSAGDKIDFSQTQWIISGEGNATQYINQETTSVDLAGYSDHINVTLKLYRMKVQNQNNTDCIQITRKIDLNLQAIKPVITYEASSEDDHLLTLTAVNSIGNINWMNAQWTIFKDGQSVYVINGVSAFNYQFPESNSDAVYSVSLTVPSANTGISETVTQIISINATPIEPVIEYEIITDDVNNPDVVKLLLNCTKSRGTGIDYGSAKWHLPIMADYGENPVQIGPTAVYTFSVIEEAPVVEVGLTLGHINGGDPSIYTQFVVIDKEDVIETEIHIDREIEQTSEGSLVTLDIFKSSGPNIAWPKTTWIVSIPGQPALNMSGPKIQFAVPSTEEKQKIEVSCDVYVNGAAQPVNETETIELDAGYIIPVISMRKYSDKFYKLSALDSYGMNIDWDRTRWYIWDGNSDVTIKQGAVIGYTFMPKEEAMSYPIMVEMFLKGSSYPFVNYKAMDIEGDEFVPVIFENANADNKSFYVFKATDSLGSNIDWQSVRWSFGDTSQDQVGPIVTHEFPLNSERKTYTVTLTICRNRGTALEEVKVVEKEITVGSDEISPVVNACYSANDNMLVLSAEKSEGRGIMLDRAVWFFPGEGDSQSSSNSAQTGVMETINRSISSSSNFNVNTGMEAGIDTSPLGLPVYFKAFAGLAYNFNMATNSSGSMVEYKPHDDYRNGSDSFSSSNQHTGPVCRRYVPPGTKTIMVSLYVFRVNSDGSFDGKQMWVNIDLNKAKVSPSNKGVIYAE